MINALRRSANAFATGVNAMSKSNDVAACIENKHEVQTFDPGINPMNHRSTDKKRRNPHCVLTVGVAVLCLCAGLTQAQNGGGPQVLVGEQVDQADTAELSEAPIRMNFRGAAVDEVLEYLSEKAGLVVIKTLEVRGVITVFSRQDMSIQEAVTVLNSILKEMGYAAILLDRTLKIVAFNDASKESIPVRVGNDPSKIAKTDEMITQVIPLKYAEAKAVVTDLDPLLPSYAVISANERSNTLIITDTSANIRRMVEVVVSLDSNLADAQDVRVYPLNYASARDAARLINETFGANQRGGASGGRGGRSSQEQRSIFFRAMRGEVNVGTRGNEQTGAATAGVNASSDERTNTIVVTGPPDTLDIVEKVVKQLDANPAAQQAVFIYKVKNGTAQQLADTLNNLFDGNPNQQSSGGGGGRSSNNRTSNQRGGRQNNQNTSADPNNTDLVGQVDIVAEEDTNSLIILTPEKNKGRVLSIVEDLDRAVPQVLIKVLIAEVTHDMDQELGVEWSVFSDSSSTDLFTDLGLSSITSGLSFSLMKNDIGFTLKALERTGKLDVLSRPYILAHENQEANITVGQRVPFITRSRTTDAGQVINDIQYESIGIILTVTPHINPDGLVVMDVESEISSISDSTVEISEDLSATVFNTRSARGRVAVQDGQTIVIGGLMQDRYELRVSKVPILGDIPLLGELFKSTRKDKEKTELLIFMTPHVAMNQKRLKNISDQEQAGLKIVPQAVEDGMFVDQMKGLERGAYWLDLDEQMNKDADEAPEESDGDMDAPPAKEQTLDEMIESFESTSEYQKQLLERMRRARREPLQKDPSDP